MLILGGLMLNITAMGALNRPLRIIRVDQAFHDSKPLHKSKQTNRLENQMMITDDFGSVHSVHTKSISKQEQDDPLLKVEVEIKTASNIDEVQIKESLVKDKTKSNSCLKRLLGDCSAGLDLALLENSEYLSLSLLSGFVMTIVLTNATFIASYAETKQFNQSEITFLLMAMNCIDIPSKILSGFLFDTNCVRQNGFLIYAVFCMLSGTCAALLAVSDNKVYCYIVWLMLQATTGVAFSQVTTVMTNVVGKIQHITRFPNK